MEESRYHWSKKGCLLLPLLMLVAIALCFTSIGVVVDVSCAKDAKVWLVDYPNAEVVSQEHSWLRPFGMGTTHRVLYTPDSRITVFRWYQDHDMELNRQQEWRDDGIATMRWRLFTVPDNEGTYIELYSDCMAYFTF